MKLFARSADRAAQRQSMHVCKFNPPSRVWEQDPYTGMWSSRAWHKGERARYAHHVLGHTIRPTDERDS